MVHTFECWRSNSCIGQISRHLETTIKEHIPKCAREHINNQPKPICIETSNAMNRSSTSDQLFKNPICEKIIMKRIL